MLEPMENSKKRDTSQKRQKILEGAIKVFTENGFEASSMDKIAQTAGVSKVTVYNHFQSKESLFQAIVSDFIKQSDEEKHFEYSTTISLNDQLMDFSKAAIYWVNHPVRRGLSKLLASVFLVNIDFVKETLSRNEPRKSFITWLNAAKADQRLYFESAELASQIFYGMVEGCVTWNALLTDGKSLQDCTSLLDEIIAVFLCRYEC